MTSKEINWSDVELAAEAIVGNWKSFDCFAWHDQPVNPDHWCIVYTHNRDSGLLDQSNAGVIDSAMSRFERYGTARQESHNHWACGWVDGWSIRVYNASGTITKAFRAYFDLMSKLADYPVLDEEDYSRRETEATIENIRACGRRMLADNAPEDWASQCYNWFLDNNQCAVESRDDQGGYPSDEEMKDCLSALGWLDAD
jgi:hypothetical protein